MKSVDTALEVLRTRYRRNEWPWLRACLAPVDTTSHATTDSTLVTTAEATSRAASVWPLRLSLGAPDERTALDTPERFRDWQSEWRTWSAPGRVVRVTRRWNRLGSQELPTHLVLDDADAVAQAIEQGTRWRRLLERSRQLVVAQPSRLARIGTLLPLLDELDDVHWSRWCSAADWLAAHPGSALYPRELPIEGVDTKTLERWRVWLERWAGASDATTAIACMPSPRMSDASGQARSIASSRLDRLGLRRLPVRIRIRALDPTLSGWPTGVIDVEMPVAELAALPLRPKRALIVENLQSALALPPLPGTLAITGLGYALEPLSSLPWLDRTPIVYWGDLDTHGLAMLGRVRGRFDDVRSMLMDEPTLLAHRGLWVDEPKPQGAHVIAGLSDAEASLYADLKRGRWGFQVRLEQERIAWAAVVAALEVAIR